MNDAKEKQRDLEAIERNWRRAEAAEARVRELTAELAAERESSAYRETQMAMLEQRVAELKAELAAGERHSRSKARQEDAAR